MKKRRFLTVMMTGMMAVSMLSGCGSGSSSASSAGTETAESTGSAEDSNVLRVGMECAYAPFNWTQDTDTPQDGSTAVPIYGSDYYAYGYDVAVAQMLAEEMGKELEIRTFRPIDRQKEFYGILKAYDDSSVTIETEEGREMTFQKSDLALIRLAFDF